jgi:hypothetical protein
MTSAISLTNASSSAMARELQAPWGRTCCFQRRQGRLSALDTSPRKSIQSGSVAAGLSAAQCAERNQPRHAARSHGTNGLVIWWLLLLRERPQT